eukprot:scaffold130349_cov63-Phaeocystis_antarctica.AAC.2
MQALELVLKRSVGKLLVGKGRATSTACPRPAPSLRYAGLSAGTAAAPGRRRRMGSESPSWQAARNWWRRDAAVQT